MTSSPTASPRSSRPCGARSPHPTRPKCRTPPSPASYSERGRTMDPTRQSIDQALLYAGIASYVLAAFALFGYFLMNRPLLRSIGMPLAILGCAAQFAELGTRWWMTGVWPLTNLYGSLSLFSALCVAIFLAFAFKYDLAFIGGFVLTLAAIAVGLPLLSLGIITGAMWAKEAWGAYWQWDAKETAALFSWIVYAAYMHLNTRPAWRGKLTAWLSVFGFASIIFCYLGVNIFISGLHSYKM